MFPSRLTLAVVVSTLLSGATAGLSVIAPGGSSLWWVDQSENTLVWNCNESGVTAFNVLLANSNLTILPQPLPIIGNLNNFVCSKTITKDLFNLVAGPGFTIQLTDILNNTNVYTESQSFEIKALGSAYPPASATPSDSGASSSGSPSGTSSGSSPSGSSTGSTGSTGGSGKATLSGLAAFAAVAIAVVV